MHLSLIRIGCGLSFEQTWIPFTQGYALCQTELKMAQRLKIQCVVVSFILDKSSDKLNTEFNI